MSFLRWSSAHHPTDIEAMLGSVTASSPQPKAMHVYFLVAVKYPIEELFVIRKKR